MSVRICKNPQRKKDYEHPNILGNQAEINSKVEVDDDIKFRIVTLISETAI